MARYSTSPKKVGIIIISTIFCFIILKYFNFTQPVETVLINVTTPITSWAIWLGHQIRATAHPETTPIITASLEAIISENAQLKKMLHLESEKTTQETYLNTLGMRAIQAVVIGKSSEPYTAALIINKGLRDGIIPNQIAITGQGSLIGIIDDVRTTHATIRLLTDSRSAVVAESLTANNTKGVVIGQQGQTMVMVLVQKDTQQAPGDVIVSSALNQNIPPGFTIGTIEHFTDTNSQLLKKALIKPLVDFDQVSLVSIIIHDHE